MSRRDPLVRMRHMLDFACDAVAMAAGKTERELDEDRKLALALTHLVELIGEAATPGPARISRSASRDRLAANNQNAQSTDPWI